MRCLTLIARVSTQHHIYYLKSYLVIYTNGPGCVGRNSYSCLLLCCIAIEKIKKTEIQLTQEHNLCSDSYALWARDYNLIRLS
jgi:hypothetical protein